MTYYRAIDIGASSGRHILAHLENGILVTEEIYRFENGVQKTAEGLTWDIEHLVTEVVNGLAEAGRRGKAPKTVAIDTWGVDYCLLDGDQTLLAPVYAYRDPERAKAVDLVHAILPHKTLYAKTGIQFQPFNTVYQLYADLQSGKLDRAKYFMQIPDYLAYRLTGKIQNEYTNATTTSLVNAETKTWDKEILAALSLPEHLFGKLTMPCEEIGTLTPELIQAIGYETTVIACPTHDTASAYVATIGGEHTCTLSSGTWSLIGSEQLRPYTNEKARQANFTNEGGIHYRFRFLKNIMGMWLIQNVRREIGKTKSYNELMSLAEESSYRKTFDVNHPSLSAPESMITAITALLGEYSLSLGDLMASIYHSLAKSYKIAITEIAEITGVRFDTLQIVGGGSSDTYLNALTKKATALRVLAGPKEGTAIGNLATQMMKDLDITLEEARSIVANSFSVCEVD